MALVDAGARARSRLRSDYPWLFMLVAPQPVLCRESDELPSGPRWAYQLKVDGFFGLLARLGAALEELRRSEVEPRIALLHYAPIEATLVGEHEQVWPFLGNYLLAEAVDRAGADLVLHGHAHRGSPAGSTLRGVPVRNVAQPLVNVPYVLIELNGKPLS